MRRFCTRRFAMLLLSFLLLLPLTASAQGPQTPPTTLSQVHDVYLPPRDLLALAQRLDNAGPIPAPPTEPLRTWAIGDQATFWVDNLETEDKFQVEATLRYMTDVVYIWVQSDWQVDQAALERSADTFSNHTYPIIHEALGIEPLPGVDGDPRLFILHASGIGGGTAAYFANDSAHPVAAVPTSNAHEMFFVNLDSMARAIGTPYYDGVLAHEFQHMVHFNNDRNEDAWLDEGLAELATLLTGFDREGFIPEFLDNPAIQLNTWPQYTSSLPHYGASMMFATYFHERFGSEGTRLLLSNPANGFDSVDSTLQQLGAADPLTGEPLTGLDIFADWVVANLINDRRVGDGRYGYALLEIPPDRPAINDVVTTYPVERTVTSPQYAAHYTTLRHTGPGRVRVSFKGAEQVQLVPASAFSGKWMVYSNRGDNSDSTLTRAFDLSEVTSATLEFATWYDIEDLWDFAYVMVSTDDGASWQILEAPSTTTEDPHHNAYGPAYTGYSGGDSPIWITERIDLSPYTGGVVLIRFEHITDEAVNAPGMVIDDIHIPEIGYAEDFEQGLGGWEPDGWLYIDNILPQQWIVQAVTHDGETTVTRLLQPGEAAAVSWEFAVGGPAGEVTLVISPVAPLTTEPGTFTLTATRISE